MPNDMNWRTDLLEKQHWMTFLLPFLVYMLVGALEPTSTKAGGEAIGLSIPYAYYPWLYAGKIALTLASIAFVWPGYRKFPFHVSKTAIVAGIIGGPLWIVLCRLDIEHQYLLPILKSLRCEWLLGTRSAFNPFEQLEGPTAAWAFLAARFLGLVAVVPLIEEFFLRGFVMRFVVDRDWWDVPFGKVNALAIALGTIFPVLSHPEWTAAAVWFSLITWLMVRTRNIWDCVAAHAITNLILGIYVVASENWRLM